MKCPKCKEEDHPQNAKFCHRCGTFMRNKPIKRKSIKESKLLKIFLLIVTIPLFIGISIYEGYNIGGTTAIVVIIANTALLGGITSNIQYKYGIYMFIPTTISVVSFYFLARFLPNIWGIIIGVVLFIISVFFAKSIEDHGM